MASINGNAGNNVIVGTAAADWIYGRGGADTISGRGGGDILDGEAGNDVLRGEAGTDLLIGGAGTYAGAGNDVLDGGAGYDAVSYSGFDVVRGITADLAAGRVSSAAGSDRIISIDSIFATRFADTLNGSDRSDSLHGGDGADRIAGRAGDDFILGEGGSDTIAGGDGEDYLSGGAGADRLTGGNGRDTFSFLEVSDSPVGSNRDVVTDFHPEDQISLFLFDANSATQTIDEFRFVGARAFTGVAQLRAARNGDDVVVQGNVDGDRAAEFEVLLTDAGAVTAGDFFL